MNKTPWTPGFWILTPCGDILGNRNTRTDNGLVAAMCSDRKDAEGAANARLIAAAPEMAEVLGALLDGCKWKEAHTFSDGTTIPAGWSTTRMPSDKLLTQARAILARIRGDAP